MMDRFEDHARVDDVIYRSCGQKEGKRKEMNLDNGACGESVRPVYSPLLSVVETISV